MDVPLLGELNCKQWLNSTQTIVKVLAQQLQLILSIVLIHHIIYSMFVSNYIYDLLEASQHNSYCVHIQYYQSFNYPIFNYSWYMFTYVATISLIMLCHHVLVSYISHIMYVCCDVTCHVSFESHAWISLGIIRDNH